MLKAAAARGRRRSRSDSKHGAFVQRVTDLLTGRGRRRRTARPRSPAASPAVAELAEDEEQEPRVWPPGRIALTDRLWGEGFITPGGAEYVIDFIQLLDLSEKKGLLNVGAGLGGPARTMAKEKGVWVTGLEALEELVEAGMERSVMAALARKAPITHFDPEKLSLREKSFNAVVAFEGFYAIRDKERLFKAFEQCLRSDGDLLFTDYVLADDREPDAKVKQWFANEPVRPRPWSIKHTVSFLGGLNFEVRVAEDITADYRRRALAGWFAFVETLTKDELTPVFAADVFDECDSWLHRMDALDSGGIRLFRFHVERLQDRRS